MRFLSRTNFHVVKIMNIGGMYHKTRGGRHQSRIRWSHFEWKTPVSRFSVWGEADPGMWGIWIAGSENAAGPGHPSAHFAYGTELFKYIIFDDPDWDYSTYDFSNWKTDTKRAARILNATDTDLTHFNVSGGKILYWSGWSDAGLTALGLIDYYEDVQGRHEEATDFTRLFLLPGVGHCAGGPGPDSVDWLDALQGWVETKPPQPSDCYQVENRGRHRLSTPAMCLPS